MIVAALAANGVTDIEDIHYIERGYDNIVEKFQKLGAKIDVVSIPDIEI
jgi:UDP-N-acetylglucosamine 1-carboxyvinyltransferase